MVPGCGRHTGGGSFGGARGGGGRKKGCPVVGGAGLHRPNPEGPSLLQGSALAGGQARACVGCNILPHRDHAG